ncbi:GNAT family N-acetyltransferase [Streptomyces sp. NPDC090025]|uniref:GNAT family N-acetyltransferase n=1 Tax=Streptomyces sp. NPDC090025 TaxID=3365922 RepID=UPI003833237A
MDATEDTAATGDTGDTGNAGDTGTAGTAASTGVVISPVDLGARVDEALAVQAVAFGLDAAEVAVRRHIVLRHLLNPGALAYGALTPEGRLVGFVYGMPNDRSHWWSTVVEPYLREGGHDHWLDDSFVITELHVHPGFQGRGLGRGLLTTITGRSDLPRSILSAIDTESPARALYRSLGYTDLARQVLFPSAPRPYAVMGAPLPLPRRAPRTGN